jgi:CBS domain-containing protein
MRADEPLSRIMTEAVVVIDVDRKVSEALDCFFQYPIHHLPVVRDGRIVGMVSSADLMKLEFFAPKSTIDRAAYLDERFTIEQLMRSPVTCLKPNDSLADAANKLMESGVHAVPVVDDTDRVLGIVTTSDIIRTLMYGPPRKGDLPKASIAQPPPSSETNEELVYHRRPNLDEYATAMRTAETLHVEARDPRYLGKAMLYLDQRRQYLEKVLELADRFLLTGQDEHVHALLLKAIHAAKRVEEHATGAARVPFPLE